MSNYKRSAYRLHVGRIAAILVGLAMVGCMSPSSAKAVDLDTSQGAKLNSGDTLNVTHGNTYNVDHRPNVNSLYISSNPRIAYLSTDTMGNVILSARSPGRTTICSVDNHGSREYTVIVR